MGHRQQLVAAACGERLIPCTMELGGKAPLVVCDDADLERTARAVVWGGFANSGQVCVSVDVPGVDFQQTLPVLLGQGISTQLGCEGLE